MLSSETNYDERFAELFWIELIDDQREAGRHSAPQPIK